ncbi:17.1 kDa class II heat shock protein-like [Silene latifolia]|uniref:17.1 kDa class II heat shock protein-like n=1 Tax=Silene latifolia TaxID=37657 RepID=UPI003D773F02
MDFRVMGLDTPILHTLHHILDADDTTTPAKPPTGAESYVRDARAMARTAADVKEYPKAYKFVIDMPGLKSGDIKVTVEDENVLVISGERKREEEEKEGGVKYLKMERRIGKFMRKFVLPENANMEAITAVCQDGVLCVTVEKLPPPEPKKPKTIEVKVA